MQPLVNAARGWPEEAFVGFLADFLYDIALGARFKSGIATDSASVAREFIPIINPSLFRGEAQFRLAEMAALVCSYEPAELGHAALRTEVDTCLNE